MAPYFAILDSKAISKSGSNVLKALVLFHNHGLCIWRFVVVRIFYHMFACKIPCVSGETKVPETETARAYFDLEGLEIQVFLEDKRNA